MSVDPFANTTTVKNILQHIISPKIVSNGSGGYVTKTDIINIDNILFAEVGSGAGTEAVPLTQQSGRVTFATRSRNITVHHLNVTATSNIMVSILKTDGNTPQIIEVLPANKTFTITLSGDTATTSQFTVGWFIASF
jgi:hypothetical protein